MDTPTIAMWSVSISLPAIWSNTSKGGGGASGGGAGGGSGGGVGGGGGSGGSGGAGGGAGGVGGGAGGVGGEGGGKGGACGSGGDGGGRGGVGGRLSEAAGGAAGGSAGTGATAVVGGEKKANPGGKVAGCGTEAFCSLSVRGFSLLLNAGARAGVSECVGLRLKLWALTATKGTCMWSTWSASTQKASMATHCIWNACRRLLSGNADSWVTLSVTAPIQARGYMVPARLQCGSPCHWPLRCNMEHQIKRSMILKCACFS